jgi:hypothetical protein
MSVKSYSSAVDISERCGARMVRCKAQGILVNPRQSLAIFGMWDQPRQVLEWQDVTARNLTWRTLRDTMKFDPESLRKLQPDPNEWVARASITLQDLPDMTCFPVHPFMHLRADLAEVWSMRWSADTLKQLNVTYEQLRAKGMNVQVMQHFNFTLGQWMSLGLNSTHVTAMDEDCVRRCFDMPKDEVIEIVAHQY